MLRVASRPIRYEVRDVTTLVQFVARGEAAGVPAAPTGEIELFGIHQPSLDDFLV